MSKSIGLIGGTGPEGTGLAARFAKAGLDVFIGSRSAEKGEEVAKQITGVAGRRLKGGTNAAAAKSGEVIIITVPYQGMRETLHDLETDLRDKVVISAVVPLQFSRARIAALDVTDGSAAEEAQLVLPTSRLVGAFHNLSASHLLDIGHSVEGDVIVCSDHIDALRETIELAGMIDGVRGINGGPLANTHYVEELTALILTINRIHKAETGIKIVGL